MEIAICGKTNVGKTTFFSAATLVDAEISNRTFTTIQPNRGVSYVRCACPCRELGAACNPRNSKCADGTRLIPVKLVDIAGLVPEAHLGRGLGNQFLSDIMEADAIIHVIDVSGSTDSSGNPVAAGSRDPEEDMAFFEKEIDYWLLGIARRALSKRMAENEFSQLVAKHLSGLKLKQETIEQLVKETGLGPDSPDEEFLGFLRMLRERSKPILVAGNKIDVWGADSIYSRLAEKRSIVPCSAASELALRKAAEKGMITYVPGNSDFEIVTEMDERHRKALEFIRERVLAPYKSTGVQQAIDRAVFELLDMIVVYPVENEHRFSDKKGNTLPDALLMKRGSTALDLAYKVHEDIGKKFISAVDARTKKSVAADYKLKNNDIISIKAGR